MFRYIPIILFLVIVLIAAFGNYIPLEASQTMLGISLSIKSFIICILPIIIFNLLFSASVNIAKDAPKLIILILGGVILSNFLATSLSNFVGSFIYKLDVNLILPATNSRLNPFEFFQFPSLIPNHIAMASGITLGFLTAKAFPDLATKCNATLAKITNAILKIISWIIPIFVIGFIIKMKYEGVVEQIIIQYPIIFATIAIAQILYISLFYLIANKFNIYNTLKTMRNMLSAVISGFSTMSSAASMPLTIVGTEKNANNKDLVHTVVPATVNIHLIGDCIAIPCFAFAILKTFGFAQPAFLDYMIFTLYFVIAKFSVAAIPGGGIIVMLPILSEYLGFNSDMIGLITAVYILFDPVITSANIFGNGAFAKLIDTIYSKRYKYKEKIFTTDTPPV